MSTKTEETRALPTIGSPWRVVKGRGDNWQGKAKRCRIFHQAIPERQGDPGGKKADGIKFGDSHDKNVVFYEEYIVQVRQRYRALAVTHHVAHLTYNFPNLYNDGHD